MELSTSKLCDIYYDTVDVMDPIFHNMGGREAFYGQVVTVKCFEHRGLILDTLRADGAGKVLVIDGGGSARRALLDEETIGLATQNGWEGIVCFGAVRELKQIAKYDIGLVACHAIPVLADDDAIGDLDVPVNFAGVTIYSEDYIYADETGVILSPEPLDLAVK